MKNKLIIVAGCSGSGKSTVSKTILSSFSKKEAQIICVDRFYKKSASLMPKVKKSGNPNFDHPDSIDWKMMINCLTNLLNGKVAMLPKYDYVHHKRLAKLVKVKPTKVIILEGVLALYSDKLNKMAELKIFVDTSMDECFVRRLERDRLIRGRTAESVVKQWTESVKPMYDIYVKPRRWVADFLLPWDKTNKNSLKYLSAAIEMLLTSR